MLPHVYRMNCTGRDWMYQCLTILLINTAYTRELWIVPPYLHQQIVNLHTNKVARILGKVENSIRFLRIALYQSDRNNKRIRKIPMAAATVNESKDLLTDPTLLCYAFKKHQIYLFSHREPEEAQDATKGRDVFNEKPLPDELLEI